MMLSAGFWSVQAFVDHMFLAWHSREALAAVLPAGLVCYTFTSVFIGTAGYVNTFVAQYSGAGKARRVGPAVWQGIHFSALALLCMLALVPFADSIFAWAGHSVEIRALESSYFRIMCLLAGPGTMAMAASCFFMGRGDTRTVMLVDFSAVAVNVLLDYAWILGNWGFPAWGIRGAAWATFVAHIFAVALLLALMLRRKHRHTYGTLRGWRPDRDLFRRLMRYGLPNGVQSLLVMFGLSIHVLLVGRLGTVPLAATNVVMNIGWVCFLPMLGLEISISTLVGRYVGRKRTDLAERCVWGAFRLSVAYVALLVLVVLLVPEVILSPFAARADPEAFQPVMEMSLTLLKFFAVFFVFDVSSLVFSSGVKGAGDTRYVMWVSAALSWVVMVVPTYLSCVVYGWGIYAAWAAKCAFITLLGVIFPLRFVAGKWKSMRVIEGDGEPGHQALDPQGSPLAQPWRNDP